MVHLHIESALRAVRGGGEKMSRVLARARPANPNSTINKHYPLTKAQGQGPFDPQEPILYGWRTGLGALPSDAGA